MKKAIRRCAAVAAAIGILLAGAFQPAQAYNPGTVDHVNTYVNTGNQRQDIIGVALTQLGYREKDVNDTKYGDWYGMPDNEWCAMFVSWCARQAEISTDILYKTSWAHPNSFRIPEFDGSSYTPKPGDLFFTEKHQHVGIVWYVEGDFFYSLEGNAKYHDYTVPNDPSVESYDVMTNKRLISAHTFGVPEYEGSDGAHRYVRGYESAHPHRVYYKCTDCADQYYTGYTECVDSCARCLSCGCSKDGAGYYTLVPSTDYLRLRTGHSWSSGTLCYATIGSVVYVYGIDRNSGWAYIDFCGTRGHVPLQYLQKYADPPVTPEVTTDRDTYIINHAVTVNWTTPSNTEQFRIQIFRNGKEYDQQRLGLVESYTLEGLPEGFYQVQVSAVNKAGASAPGSVEFTVRDTYVVTYDPREGGGAPESQAQTIGKEIVISETQPVREGYRFLGWTRDESSNIADLHGADTLIAVEDLTLYAVWQQEGATPQALTVTKAPDRYYYLLGDSLETEGLVLQLMYSDGSGHTLTEGFTVNGFESENYGVKTLTFTYEELTATCEVEVVPYIPGDIDQNRVVNRDDVIALLLHVSMPDTFLLEVPADFNDDGQVTRDDVIALLLHVSMPGAFPLKITTTT